MPQIKNYKRKKGNKKGYIGGFGKGSLGWYHYPSAVKTKSNGYLENSSDTIIVVYKNTNKNSPKKGLWSVKFSFTPKNEKYEKNITKNFKKKENAVDFARKIMSKNPDGINSQREIK